jgi:RNA-directed DNA polymerase
LAPEKTRLIQFGRFAAQQRQQRGLGRPESFAFLGFTHLCSKTKNGRFLLKRVTIAKRMQAKLREVKDELKRRRHLSIPEQGQWLGSVLRGHYAYYAVPGNSDAIIAFHRQATWHWYRALRRRSQRTRLNWDRMHRITARWLPPPRRMHPFPNERFDAKHPRQEPSALTRSLGSARGAVGNDGPYR